MFNLGCVVSCPSGNDRCYKARVLSKSLLAAGKMCRWQQLHQKLLRHQKGGLTQIWAENPYTPLLTPLTKAPRTAYKKLLALPPVQISPFAGPGHTCGVSWCRSSRVQRPYDDSCQIFVDNDGEIVEVIFGVYVLMLPALRLVWWDSI